MKKAYFKKEFKKLYVEMVTKAAVMVINAEPETEEDGLYILNSAKDIAAQKSTNNDLYDALSKELPDFSEKISKEDFTSLMQAKLKEMFDSIDQAK